MLKTILLASAMTISVPAMAQDTPQQAPATGTTVPTQQQTPTAPVDSTAQQAPTTQAAPIPGAPTTDPAPAQQATARATDPGVTTADTTAPAQTAATTPEAGAATTGATQIAQVVSTEFPTYDKNADKSLDKAEFGQWMVALKTASDPSTKAADPTTKKWIEGAFATADKDKSKSVTQAELTTYLSQGAG